MIYLLTSSSLPTFYEWEKRLVKRKIEGYEVAENQKNIFHFKILSSINCHYQKIFSIKNVLPIIFQSHRFEFCFVYNLITTQSFEE